jgi:methylase of polypeptide subunit release factors
LLYALLGRRYPDLHIHGVDISNTALRLANDNLQHNLSEDHLPEKALEQVSFMNADVLSGASLLEDLPGSSNWDVVISNPPYISQTGFGRDTSRSVRNWEPKLALVPSVSNTVMSEHLQPEDVFYHHILNISKTAGARYVLMEVGDTHQALRVAEAAVNLNIWTSVEIWRDWPESDPASVEDRGILHGQIIAVKGSGHGRSVFCRR